MPIETFKCPNCGGDLVFDPKTQLNVCHHCHSQFTKAEMSRLQGEGLLEPNPAAGQPEPAQTQSQSGPDAALYECPGCGAEIMTDATTAATHCFYCHTPVILKDRFAGPYLPDQVIPFTVEKQTASDGLLNWIKKKKFVPKDFACESQLEKTTGVYFPVWYVDADIDASLSARGTQVRRWSDSRFDYTETSYFDIGRTGSIAIQNIPKKALNKEESKLYETVLPFDETQMKPFTTTYLSGFQAERRNIETDSLRAEVEKENDRQTKKLLQGTVSGYSTVTGTKIHVQKHALKWKYTMLPVWAMTYHSGGKTYFYAMNGQTGKVNGRLPVDQKKLALTSLFLGLAVFILCFLIFMIFMNGGNA